MSDMGLNPELINLFLQASGSPSGASRTSNLLDDVLLAYIAGGANPQTFVGNNVGGGSSRLMQNYMNDPNPAMQEVIKHIQGGTDPYRLSSFVDSVVANMSGDVTDLGFTPSDFKNLALAMNREFTGTEDSGGSSGGGSGKSGFDFSRAGLSNPLDVYDVTNAPLNEEAVRMIAEQQRIAGESGKKASQAEQKARMALTSAKENPSSMYRGYDFKKTDDIVNSLANAAQKYGGSNTLGVRNKFSTMIGRLKKESQNGLIDEDKVEEKIREFTKDGRYKLYESSMKEFIADTKKALKKSAVQTASMDVESPDFWKWRKNVEEARKEAYNAQEAGRQEMAVRTGAAKAANAAGRTPLGDELKNRLALLAKLQK